MFILQYVFEEEESPSIPLKDLFLLQLPDEQNFLVFYSNGRKAISKTSNGYIALFDNVSSSVRVGFGCGSGSEIGRSLGQSGQKIKLEF